MGKRGLVEEMPERVVETGILVVGNLQDPVLDPERVGLPTRRRTAKQSSPSPQRGEGGGEGDFPRDCRPPHAVFGHPLSTPRSEGENRWLLLPLRAGVLGA